MSAAHRQERRRSSLALPYIAGSLAISNYESTWSLTTYLVAITYDDVRGF